MYYIGIPLTIGEETSTGNVVFGFMHEGAFVFDPFKSPCGSVSVRASEAYGIDDFEAWELQSLNRMLQSTAEKAAQGAVWAVHSSMEMPDDSTLGGLVTHEMRQALARSIAAEMLKLMSGKSAAAEPEDRAYVTSTTA